MSNKNNCHHQRSIVQELFDDEHSIDSFTEIESYESLRTQLEAKQRHVDILRSKLLKEKDSKSQLENQNERNIQTIVGQKQRIECLAQENQLDKSEIEILQCEKEGLIEINLAQSMQMIGVHGKMELCKEEIQESWETIDALNEEIEQLKQMIERQESQRDQIKDQQLLDQTYSLDCENKQTQIEELHEQLRMQIDYTNLIQEESHSLYEQLHDLKSNHKQMIHSLRLQFLSQLQAIQEEYENRLLTNSQKYYEYENQASGTDELENEEGLDRKIYQEEEDEEEEDQSATQLECKDVIGMGNGWEQELEWEQWLWGKEDKLNEQKKWIRAEDEDKLSEEVRDIIRGFKKLDEDSRAKILSKDEQKSIDNWEIKITDLTENECYQ